MSEDRKARLAALAARAGRNQPPSIGNTNDSKDEPPKESKPSISFRNYVPKDAALDPSLSLPVNDDGEPSSANATRQRQSQHLSKRQKIKEEDDEAQAPKSALEQALAKTNRESREAAGQNVGGGWSKITPVSTKKVNWDLKRDIQSKMDRLERRTQRAIVELLRERLEKEAREDGGVDDDDSDLD